MYFCFVAEPFTDYKIIIKAFTTKFEGEPSDPVFQRTDISGPSQPIIMNLTCHSEDSIVLKWKRPFEYYQTIDSYVVNYRIAGRERFREIELNASADVLETSVSPKMSCFILNLENDDPIHLCN